MRILVACEQGNNRSTTIGQLVKYKYNADVLTIGLRRNTVQTKEMLYQWADIIIVVQQVLKTIIPNIYYDKVVVWDVGEDQYPRPYNPELLQLVRQIMEQNPLIETVAST